MYHCWGYRSAPGDRKHAQPHGLALSRSAENTIFSTITSENPHDLPIYQHLLLQAKSSLLIHSTIHPILGKPRIQPSKEKKHTTRGYGIM